MRFLRLGRLAVALILMNAGMAAGGRGSGAADAAIEPMARQFEDIDPKQFDRSAIIDNEWMPLRPGTQFVYEGFTSDNDERVPHRLIVNVTDLTKVIDGVRAVVVFERDFRSGQLVEAELAFFAQDNEGSVWHLGEYSEVYEENELVGGRAFLVGHLDGARGGVMMPAKPRPGTPSYSQGYAPPPFNWTDRGRVYQMGQKTRVPAGSYEDVLVTQEFSDTEPEAIQLKYYARGVGNVRVNWKGKDPSQETLELVKLVQLGPEDMDKVRAEALDLEKRAYVYGSTPPAERMPAAK